MNEISTIHPGPRHDRKSIKDFLMQLAGELKLDQAALAGKHVSDKLMHGIQQYRAKYGTHLLPEARSGGNATAAAEASDPEVARQEMIARRANQLKQVIGVIDLLGELRPDGPPPAV